MGIRFERGHKRATNGPLIFFSLLRDEIFAEEIRSAFVSGLSFYAYRFPGDSMMTYGSSEEYIEGIGEPGFVIGRFNPSLPVITIPYKRSAKCQEVISDNREPRGENQDPYAKGSEHRYEMPLVSTTYEEYSHEVEDIVGAIRKGKGEKVVAARVIVKEKEFDLAEKFYDLCQKFPDAFIFCFSTPATGCWMGATPELLLESREGVIHSMALAGTRPINTQGPWDEKNIEEQNIVTEYIVDIFRRNGFDPKVSHTFTKQAGSIEHICNLISAGCQDPNAKEERKGDIKKLIRDLSPTPALCGHPKSFALEMINKLENFDRGCYGGFCGSYRGDNDFTLNVVLRCASLTQQRCCVYVGGGITSQSHVSSEWNETQMKSKAFE